MIYRILNWIYDSKVLRVVVALLVFCLIPPSTSAQSVTIPDLLNTLTFEGELVGISPDGTFILFFSSEDRALLTKDIYGNDVQVISDLQHPMDLQFITNTLVYVNYSTNDQPLAELLDVVSGTRFDTYRGSVRRAEINGDYLFVSREFLTHRYDVATISKLSEFDGEGLSISENGEILATYNNFSRESTLYDIQTGSVVLRHQGHLVDFSPDTRYATFTINLSTEGLSRVDLVEIATNGLVAEYGGNNGSFSPDNQLLQISGNSVNRIIDLQSQETLFDFPGCMALRRTPNGQSLICHTYNRLAVVIDFDTGIRSDPINAYWVIDFTNEMLITYTAPTSYFARLPSGEVYMEVGGRAYALSPNERYVILRDLETRKSFMIAIDSQERLLSGDRIFFSDHNDFAFVLEGATLSIYDIGIN